MLKEVKNVVYLFTIFFSIFFIINYYISENNVKLSNKVILQHQNELDNKFSDLPIIESDTNNIIEYTNEIEKFKNKKQRKFWDLFKTNEK